jgi:uncharacterized protein (DUF983 family)
VERHGAVAGETRSEYRAVARALLKRCPRCGQGKLFRAWFRMVKRCPRCGLVFERDEGSRLGSAMLNYAVVGVALVAYIVIAFVLTLPDPPVVPMLIGAAALITFVSLAFFPFAKTLWTALDLVLHGFRLDD